MIEQLLLIYVVSAVLFFCWQVWVYYTGARFEIEQMKTHVNGRDKQIYNLVDANKLLNAEIVKFRNENAALNNTNSALEHQNKKIGQLLTNKTGETVAKKATKTKYKKPMKK